MKSLAGQERQIALGALMENLVTDRYAAHQRALRNDSSARLFTMVARREPDIYREAGSRGANNRPQGAVRPRRPGTEKRAFGRIKKAPSSINASLTCSFPRFLGQSKPHCFARRTVRRRH